MLCPLEKEIATHSSILALRILWTEDLGGLQSMELQKVRHNWATNKEIYRWKISIWKDAPHQCHQRNANQSKNDGTSLLVHWLRLRTFTAKGWGSIPGQETDPTDHVSPPKTDKLTNKKLPHGDTTVLFCSVLSLSCVRLFAPLDCSMPGFPVLHCLPEFAQTYVHWVSDAIQPSHSPLTPSLPALNLPQHQDLFQWISFSHQMAKVLELQR